jgi:hypothetical protein
MANISTAAALAATQIAHATQPEASPKKGLINYPYYFARVDFKLNSQRLDLNSFALKLQKTKGERLFDEFKAKKADFLILPNNEQRKKENALKATSERNIDTPTLEFMPAVQARLLPKCLIILDFDKAPQYEAAKAKFKDFARAEKSQKGGHLWLDISELLSDPSAYLALRNALPHKLKNARGEEFGESFWGEIDGGQVFYTPRLKTQTRAYYSLDFDNLSPAPLDLLNELENCKGDFLTPPPQAQETPQETPNAPQQKAKPKKELKAAKTPQNDENEERDSNGYFIRFRRKWWDKNSKLMPLISRLDKCESAESADIVELKSIYNDSTRALPLENIQEGNRNATISALAAFLGHYGYFENFASFENILVKIAGRLCDLPSDEVKTIANGKIQFLLDKNEYENAKQKASEMDLIAELCKRGAPYFIAHNAKPANGDRDAFVICDFRDNNAKSLLKTTQKIAIASLLRENENSPQIRWGETKDGTPKPTLRLDRIPTLQFCEDGREFLAKSDPTHYNVTGHLLGENPKIKEILANGGGYDLNELRKWYENSPFNILLKNNLIPDYKLRVKFLGDFGYFLRTHAQPNHALTICDKGGTGKSFFLGTLLDYCERGDYAFKEAFNQTTTEPERLRNEINQVQEIKKRVTTPQASVFLGRFNEAMPRRGVCIIKEDGDYEFDKNKRYSLYENLKNYLGDTQSHSEHKGKGAETISYHTYILIFTNKKINYNEDSNRRFYFSYGAGKIPLDSAEGMREFFGEHDIRNTAELQQAIFKEREKYLAYFLLCAPFEKDYPGYYKIESYGTYAKDLNDVLSFYREDNFEGISRLKLNAKDFAYALASYLMDGTELDLNKLLECYKSDTPPLAFFGYLLFKTFNQSELPQQLQNLQKPEGFNEKEKHLLREMGESTRNKYISSYESYLCGNTRKALDCEGVLRMRARDLKSHFLELFYQNKGKDYNVKIPTYYKDGKDGSGVEFAFAKVFKQRKDDKAGDATIIFTKYRFESGGLF